MFGLVLQDKNKKNMVGMWREGENRELTVPESSSQLAMWIKSVDILDLEMLSVFLYEDSHSSPGWPQTHNDTFPSASQG